MSEVLVAVGTRKGLWLLRSADRATWKVDGPHMFMRSVAACAIDTRGDSVRLLAGASSSHWGPAVSWSDDLGASWTEAADGSGIRFRPDEGASVEAVWQLRPDTAGRPGVVWAGTEPSALWRSTDGGQTFSLVEGLWNHPHRPTWEPGFGGQAIHTVLPHPSDDARVLVAMSTGGVYVTEDGGTTWAPSNRGITADFLPGDAPEYGQCVHKVTRDATDPERLFAQNHGGVFHSDDGGTSWTSVGAGLPKDFGFPVVAHPRRSRTAWVVPMVDGSERVPPDGELQVWRTDDAGETWKRGSEGLPTRFYGVVLRDAMATDDAEPPGVYFGTRDGTLYASLDDGDTWSTLAQHLPDVLCVRAAVLP
jgi:photosystem II stability/assembly factor-like uncharacterized protein